MLDDQLTKAFASKAGIVAHNPSYAFGVLGGAAPFLIAGMVFMVAFSSSADERGPSAPSL